VAKLCFFVGKGGVGKTTVSAAYAVHGARSRKSVLLLSTDPAHSLADILGNVVGDAPARVRSPGRGKLFASQIDSERRFHQFLKRHKKQLLDVLENGSIFSREDIEPLLEATFPGMAEMAALLATHEAMKSGQYDLIVVDTAPFGHTLRLFGLPEQFLKLVSFLELSASRDQILAAHFGGTGHDVGSGLLRGWRSMVEEIQRTFTSGSSLFLVTTPEKFALQESLRARDILRQQNPPLEMDTVVLNRVVVAEGKCRACATRVEAARAAQVLIKREFPGRKMFVGEDRGEPVAGVAALAAFGDHVFAGKRAKWTARTPNARDPKWQRAQWPALQLPVTLVTGKGGVGKTTLSAGLAFHTREATASAVEICSVDPAPSLDDVFRTAVEDQPAAIFGDAKFRASEMDSVAEYERWAEGIRRAVNRSLATEVRSVHVDFSFERQLILQLLDSVPPGLDEILAVFRILDLAKGAATRVVVDMAPTGHALELLRTPDRILQWSRLLLKTLATHRTLAVVQDVAVQVAQLGRRAREISEILGQPGRSGIVTVMLAEALPDRETERLMGDLGDLGLRSDVIFVNRVIFPRDAAHCRRCQRARKWQMATLSRLKSKYQDAQIFVVRNFSTEIAGQSELRKFTGELWQLA
jgi:arsenite-transporting ATPase